MLSKVDAIKLIFNFLKKQKEIQILELDAKILHEKQRHANIKDFQIIKALESNVPRRPILWSPGSKQRDAIS